MLPVNIELTVIDMELFKQFRQYQDQFKILLEEGVFGNYTGCKEIHKESGIIKMVKHINIKRL